MMPETRDVGEGEGWEDNVPITQEPNVGDDTLQPQKLKTYSAIPIHRPIVSMNVWYSNLLIHCLVLVPVLIFGFRKLASLSR